MTNEQIKQAATDFAEREYEVSDIDKDPLHKGFYHGALWRINSVWHTKKEKPICKGERKFCDIFYISKNGYPRTNTYSECGCLLYRGEEWRDVKYWAYVDDLLPDGMEDDHD